MTPSFYMLRRVLIKPFYRQNAGLFLFLLVVMFGVVGELDGADMLDYHYALIRGAIGNRVFFLLVLLLWSCYAWKCLRFVGQQLAQPELSFLKNINLLPSSLLFRQLLVVQAAIFLPIGLYALVVAAVAGYRHAPGTGLVVLGYVSLVCAGSTWWYLRLLQHRGRPGLGPIRFGFVRLRGSSGYTLMLFRYLLGSQKLLWGGLALYTCGMLCAVLLNITGPDYDISLPFMLYLFGLLGHGVLLYQLRGFEETFLSFYRGLPIGLSRRFARYAGMCLLMLVPELVAMGLLTPAYLRPGDALLLAGAGFALLLFLYTVLFLEHYTMLGYLKVCFLLLFVCYMALMAHLLWALVLLLPVLAFFFFLQGYYRYERTK